MGSVRLYGSVSGYTELSAPDVSPSGVLVMPATAGTIATTAEVATAKAEAVATPPAVHPMFIIGGL
jgi:hypothetical protein